MSDAMTKADWDLSRDVAARISRADSGVVEKLQTFLRVRGNANSCVTLLERLAANADVYQNLSRDQRDQQGVSFIRTEHMALDYRNVANALTELFNSDRDAVAKARILGWIARLMRNNRSSSVRQTERPAGEYRGGSSRPQKNFRPGTPSQPKRKQIGGPSRPIANQNTPEIPRRAEPIKRDFGTRVVVKFLGPRPEGKSGFFVQETGKQKGVLNLGTAPPELPEMEKEVQVYIHDDNPQCPQYRWDVATSSGKSKGAPKKSTGGRGGR